MSDIPNTQYSLLTRLADPSDREAWGQFTDLYRPVIYRIARGRGMQDADAQDLVQQVLMSVAQAIPAWERISEQVRFRHWLKKVTKNAVLNALTRGPRETVAASSAFFDGRPDDDCESSELDRQIDREHRREIYRQAAMIVQQQVQPTTWEAFQLSAVLGQPMEHVSRETGLTVGSVYVAKSRVLSRLREAVAAIEEGLEL